MLSHFPFRVSFDAEKGIDAGGLARDALSGFWEESYRLHFDGSSLVVPVLHPSSDLSSMPLLGRIISHGYIACGCLPVRLVFPTLCTILCGSSANISDDILVDYFLEYLPEVDRITIRTCIQNHMISPALKSSVISVFSRFGCLEVPTINNILRLCAQIARHEFLMKPMAAIGAIASGIPSHHSQFWASYSVHTLHKLYVSLAANPTKVVQQIEEPFFESKGQERVFNFLLTYVGSMKSTEVQQFLRFVTGSSVCSAKNITVSFNSLSGFTRRPIAHTCSSSLHLSTSYATYTEFAEEFSNVLSSPDCWKMNSI